MAKIIIISNNKPSGLSKNPNSAKIMRITTKIATNNKIKNNICLI